MNSGLRTSDDAVASISRACGGCASRGRVSGRRCQAMKPTVEAASTSVANIARQPNPAARKPPSTGASELPSTATIVSEASIFAMRSAG